MKDLEVIEGTIKTVEDAKFKLSGTDGERIIEGYFTTADIDRGNDISLPSAFEKTMKSFMATGGVICFNHNWDKPVGKVISYRIDNKGVFIRAKLVSGVNYVDDLWQLAKQGMLKCFSYGYRTLDSGIKKIGEKVVQELRDIDLLEISLVTVPMNNQATFVVANGNVKSIIPHDGKSVIAEDRELAYHIQALTASIQATIKSINTVQGRR